MLGSGFVTRNENANFSSIDQSLTFSLFYFIFFELWLHKRVGYLVDYLVLQHWRNVKKVERGWYESEQPVALVKAAFIVIDQVELEVEDKAKSVENVPEKDLTIAGEKSSVESGL